MSQRQQTSHNQEEPQRLTMVAEARNKHLCVGKDYVNQQETYLLVEPFRFLWDLTPRMVIKLTEYVVEVVKEAKREL